MQYLAVVALALSLIALSNAAQGLDGRYTLRYSEKTKKYTVSDDGGKPEDGEVVSTASYNATYLTTGWDMLRIDAPSSLMNGDTVARDHAHYAAGYLEGFLTHARILASWHNYVKKENDTCNENANFTQWVQNHTLYMEELAKKGDSYSARLGHLLQQMKGVAAGNAAARIGDELALSESDIFFMNFMYDADSVVTAVTSKEDLDFYRRYPNLDPRDNHDHCNALIRTIGHDLFVSHVSWNHFTTMLRQYKTYAFDSVVSMSGFPGMIFSVDDWYITSKGMAITETTIGVPNEAIYRQNTKPESVSEFLRTMIATYMCDSGRCWTNTFSEHNSGSYNNQWMIVDMKLFKPNVTIVDDTLWVLEQIPGKIVSADKSDVLRTKGYWASYNIEVFPEIRNLGGANEREARLGTFFSVTESPRAKMFARDAPNVHDLAGMKHLMRYNDFEHDDLSLIPNCSDCTPAHSAMIAIASRGDLNPPNGESKYGPLERWVGQRNHGATDCKIASWSNMQGTTLTGVVIDGPTSEGQPAFVWSTSPFKDLRHDDHPDRFDFAWQEISTVMPPRPQEESKSKTGLYVGLAVGAVAVIGIIGGIWYVRYRNPEGEPAYSKL